MNFLTGSFAVAGLVAALGPILIHLMNRRRFRVESWAAMDFLREALQRNRKVVQLRDLILLALRIIALAAFGFALARPFLTDAAQELTARYAAVGLLVLLGFGLAIRGVLAAGKRGRRLSGVAACAAFAAAAFWGWKLEQSRSSSDARLAGSRQPVHAILLIDNSLSMARRTLDGTLLERAQRKAVEFVEDLPPGSRVAVLPICGATHAWSADATPSLDAATEAVEAIAVVDRSASLAAAVALAETACEQLPELPAKRVVLFSDQQQSLWAGSSSGSLIARLPDLQVVHVGSSGAAPANVSISDLRVPDGLADVGGDTLFLVNVQYSGSESVEGANVALLVDGQAVATQTVDLEPAQERELEFRQRIDIQPGEQHVGFVTVAAQITAPDLKLDQIAEDNLRHLAVPAAASLPVVFVDELGPDETPDQRGTTYRLRRKLAPRAKGDDTRQPLVDVRHLKLEMLDRTVLSDARLVVIAGAAAPTPEQTTLLRDYVSQGGQLVIVAGGDFAPADWTTHGYAGGRGILPLPLAPELAGTPLSEVRSTEDFHVDFLDASSITNALFDVPGESREQQRQLYRKPQFYRYAVASADDKTLADWKAARTKELEGRREWLAESDQKRAAWADARRSTGLSDEDRAEQQRDAAERQQREPNWLRWRAPMTGRDTTEAIAAVVNREAPEVLARFEASDSPVIARSRIDRGDVYFFAGGVENDWSNLFDLPASLIFDRILIQAIDRTLPRRNFPTGDRIVLPVDASRDSLYGLDRPDGFTETLPVQAVGPSRYGLSIERVYGRGQYDLAEIPSQIDSANSPGVATPRRQISLAVNGPPGESDVSVVTQDEFTEAVADAENVSWVDESEPIVVEGAAIRAQGLWKTLIGIALAALLLEMLVLSLPARTAKGDAS